MASYAESNSNLLRSEEFGYGSETHPRSRVCKSYLTSETTLEVMLMCHRINRLMFDLLTKPKEFSTSIKRTTASIASITLFGHRAPDFESFWAYVSLQVHSPRDAADLTSTGCLYCDGSGKTSPTCHSTLS